MQHPTTAIFFIFIFPVCSQYLNVDYPIHVTSPYISPLLHKPYTLEPEEFPYPNGVEKPESGVRFHYFSGNVYRMTPMAGFRPLAPGRSKAIRYVSEHHCVSRTDVHPNWSVRLSLRLLVILSVFGLNSIRSSLPFELFLSQQVCLYIIIDKNKSCHEQNLRKYTEVKNPCINVA